MSSGVPVSVGDKFVVAGTACVVVEVQSATDVSGIVSFTEASTTLTVQLASGVPLDSVSDDHFCAFVLQNTNDDTKYGVGVYHPSLGLRIAPSPLAVKPINETIVMGWMCPQIAVQHEGIIQEDESVTFVVVRQSTDDGLVLHLHGADSFINMGSGTVAEWITDAEGIVKRNRADGSGLHQIYFPCGHGALFQRSEDLRDMQADEPGEYATAVWCYHRGVRVVVEEGEDVVLNWATGSIAFTGTPGAKAYAWIEDVVETGYVILDEAGKGTIEDLAPGFYICVEHPADDNWRSMAVRTSCDVVADESAEVNLPALASPPEGKNWLDVYDYEDVPISGDLYASSLVGFGEEAGENAAEPLLIGTGTRIEFDWEDFPIYDRTGVVLIGDTAFQILGADPESDRTCYQATARARCVLLPSGSGYLVWWNEGVPHRDLTWDEFAPPFVLHEHDDRQTDAAFETIPGGVRSESICPRPAPTWRYVPDPPDGHWEWAVAGDYNWEVVDQEGGVIWNMGSLGTDGGLENGTYPQSHQAASKKNAADYFIGGKLSGNVVDGCNTDIDIDGLAEANRYGLEWGGWCRHEVRVLSGDGTESSAHAGVFTGNTCPLCHGPVWRWPSVDGYTYGYCTQSGCRVDARTWIRSPSVASGQHLIRVIQQLPNEWSSRALDKWLRPANYLEDGDYLQTYLGSSRWVCVHAELAAWSGSYNDGDDTTDIADTNNLEELVYVQPKILPVSITTDATYIVSCVMADDSLQDYTVVLTAGMDTPQRITGRAKIAAANADNTIDPAACGFIKDVTDIVSDLSGDSNVFTVVADVPIFVDLRTPIVRAAQTPWTCQCLTLVGQPDMAVDPAGRLWLVRSDGEGNVQVFHRDSLQRPWEPHTDAFDDGQYENPSIVAFTDGRFQVSATLQGGENYVTESRDDGQSWTVLS